MGFVHDVIIISNIGIDVNGKHTRISNIGIANRMFLFWPFISSKLRRVDPERAIESWMVVRMSQCFLKSGCQISSSGWAR